MPQMYSGAWQVFSETKKKIVSGEISLIGDSFKIALMKDSWTPDLNLDVDWEDISSHEVSVVGYTVGGKVLSGKTLTNYGNKITWSVNTTTLGVFNESVIVKYAVIYDDTHTDDCLVCYCLLNSNNLNVSGTNFDLLFPQGIITLS